MKAKKPSFSLMNPQCLEHLAYSRYLIKNLSNKWSNLHFYLLIHSTSIYCKFIICQGVEQALEIQRGVRHGFVPFLLFWGVWGLRETVWYVNDKVQGSVLSAVRKVLANHSGSTKRRASNSTSLKWRKPHRGHCP